MKVYHFHNGSGGGVLSVIKNLLRFSTNGDIENHIIHAVNKGTIEHYVQEHIEGAISQQVYYYSPATNFYHTCRQLARLLPDDKTVIVAHDWIELGIASNLGLQNPVVHILHGDYDYYYELAKRHRGAINAYICISPKIFQTMKEILPSRTADIFIQNFPVPPVSPRAGSNGSLRMIYYVRDLTDHRKQFSTIIDIARQLSDTPDDYFFTIAGGGMMKEAFFEIWPPALKNRVNYISHKTNEEILTLLPAQDVFLLPSIVEGLPVSLVESMKAGLVPLVTNWDRAVDELVSDSLTGYFFKVGAAADYVEVIKKLQADRQLLEQLSKNCVQRANELFDPVNNTKKYESVYLHAAGQQVKKKPLKTYGSRLDQPWLGNDFTYAFRSKTRKG